MTIRDRAATVTPTLPRARLIASRVGLVLAGLMALPNLVNAAFQLVAGPPDVAGEATPPWVATSLLVAGVVTLAFLVPAWRGHNAATWAVALSRFSELSALTVFVGGFPALDSERPLYVLIAGVATVIGTLVLLGLRPAGPDPAAEADRGHPS